MILNTFAVVDFFLVILRFALGITVFWLSVAAWRSLKSPQSDSNGKFDSRYSLLFLVAWPLMGLTVASWPVTYLLLQSYIPQWPGVMCIYGVTQVGTGSVGASRFLPRLLLATQLLKPGVVFMSGAWCGLHVINQRTRTGPLTVR